MRSSHTPHVLTRAHESSDVTKAVSGHVSEGERSRRPAPGGTGAQTSEHRPATGNRPTRTRTATGTRPTTGTAHAAADRVTTPHRAPPPATAPEVQSRRERIALAASSGSSGG